LKTAVFPSTKISSELANTYGYHEWMVGRFLEYMPDVEKCLAAMEGPVNTYVRINTIKIDSARLLSLLEAKGIETEPTELPEVHRVVRSTLPIGATSEYLAGLYYIQDLSSCIPVEELDIHPSQQNLDMASAPGGKTTFMAQKMKNSGILFALEYNRRRIPSVVFNLSRCGVINTALYNIDGRAASSLNRRFDRVLLDAPCTCEGIITKDKKRKTSHRPSDIEISSLRQSELLTEAVKVVKQDGLVIYSTCSFAPEENELVINQLLETSEINVTVEPVCRGLPGLTRFGDISLHPTLSRAGRLYPHMHRTAGFFIAKLRRGS
jgi:NOL1/NOP2/sun family putative RNA methylase